MGFKYFYVFLIFFSFLKEVNVIAQGSVSQSFLSVEHFKGFKYEKEDQ